MKFIAELDGNALYIKREDFIDLAESNAVFIELTSEKYAELCELMDIKHCKKCNSQVIEFTNHKGLCDEYSEEINNERKNV